MAAKAKPVIRHRVTLEVKATLEGLLNLVHDLPEEVPAEAEVMQILTYAACPEDIAAMEEDPDMDTDDIPEHEPEMWMDIILEWQDSV